MIKSWKKIKTRKRTNFGGHYEVHQDRVIAPSGKETDYFIVRKNPSVLIVPINENGEIYMTRLHRYTTGNFELEFPCGHMEKSDHKSFIKAAKRELEEELGLRSNKWEKICKIFEASGIASATIHIFVAYAVFKTKNPTRDPGDKNLHETNLISKSQLNRIVRQGKISNSNTLATIAIIEKKGIFS